MTMNRLPEDGELELAAVRLPPGRRILSGRSFGPVAWATTEPGPARAGSGPPCRPRTATLA